MAHVETVAVDAATGELGAIYGAAIARAGKVFQILQVQSLNPRSLRASLQLYQATTVAGSEGLPRWMREANNCHY
jgi:hypothetical protein